MKYIFSCSFTNSFFKDKDIARFSQEGCPSEASGFLPGQEASFFRTLKQEMSLPWS